MIKESPHDFIRHQDRYSYSPDAVMPPQSNLKLSYVIPIRGEVSNGNFFLQLRDFTTQSRIEKDEYEVLYVRNNPLSDVTQGKQYLAENETVLATIRYIQGTSHALPQLEDWQEKIVRSAKKHKLQVNTMMIDPNDLQGSTGDNIDGSRVEGENLAKERFAAINFNGGIVILDGDTRFHRDTSRQIIDQLNQSDVGMLRIPYDLIPGEGGRRLFETTACERFDMNDAELTNIIEKRKKQGWYAVKADSLETRISTSFNLDRQRDELLPTQGKSMPSQNIYIYVADRMRSSDVAGGYSNTRREAINQAYTASDTFYHPGIPLTRHIYKEIVNQGVANTDQLRLRLGDMLETFFPNEPAIIPLKNKIKNLERASFSIELGQLQDRTKVSAKEYAEHVVSLIGGISNSPEELEEYVTKEINHEKTRRAVVIGAVKRLLDKVYVDPSGNDFTSKRNSLYAHFLNANPWIQTALQDAYAAHPDSKEEAWQELQTNFSEFLSPLEETNFTYGSSTLKGVVRYLENHPLF